MKRVVVLLSCALMTTMVSGGGLGTAVAATTGPPSLQRVADDVVGVELDVPATWRTYPDPVLFNTYGFAVFADDGPTWGGHERSPVARISRAYQLTPDQVDGVVDDLMRKYGEFPLRRYAVKVGGVLTGTAVSGLPGTDPYTLVYVADTSRVYRIGLWTPEPGLDARALALLAGLRFRAPTRPVSSLGLTPVEQATYTQPAPEELARNTQANQARAALVTVEGGEPATTGADGAESAPPATAACEFGQPSGLFWQTTWDYTNRFYSGYTTSYSGTYYNLRPGDPGWSAMSGNYGSWWGQNYHIRKCDPYLLNQYYANDWPAHRNANGYSATKGTVEWAGWDYYDSEGYYTLGNYVVVRNGSYRALMAHFTSLAPGISWGATVGMNTVIGYVGRTGGPWDEHIHSRLAYGESLTYNGQPYGGSTVWPTRLRCVSCRANDPGDTHGNGDGQFDYKDSNGAKYYTRFYHGRWMRG